MPRQAIGGGGETALQSGRQPVSLGQDELALAGNTQPIDPAGMLNLDHGSSTEQSLAVDAAYFGTAAGRILARAGTGRTGHRDGIERVISPPPIGETGE